MWDPFIQCEFVTWPETVSVYRIYRVYTVCIMCVCTTLLWLRDNPAAFQTS